MIKAAQGSFRAFVGAVFYYEIISQDDLQTGGWTQVWRGDKLISERKAASGIHAAPDPKVRQSRVPRNV